MERFIDRDWLPKLKGALGRQLPLDESDKFLYYDGKILKNLGLLSSKDFRASRDSSQRLCTFKFGLVLTPIESASWLYKLNRLTSVRHKSLLLRIAHGEIYTKEKLYRYNLTDTDRCHICGDIETLNHKFITCTYAERIWECVGNFNGLAPEINSEPGQIALGAWLNRDILNMTVRAEILQRLSYLKEQSYVIRPKLLVKMAIENLRIRESNTELKSLLDHLLDE